MAMNNRKSRLRVGDTVVVTSGAHKGSTGEVTRFSKDRTRVFVEGVNIVKHKGVCTMYWRLIMLTHTGEM